MKDIKCKNCKFFVIGRNGSPFCQKRTFFVDADETHDCVFYKYTLSRILKLASCWIVGLVLVATFWVILPVHFNLDFENSMIDRFRGLLLFAFPFLLYIVITKNR